MKHMEHTMIDIHNDDRRDRRGHRRHCRHPFGRGIDRAEMIAAAMAGAEGFRETFGRRLHGMRGGFGGEFGRDFRGGFGGRGAGGPGGGHGGGRRGGGRRKRLFDQSELQTLLLALIVDAPRHGYELIREVEALSGGDYAPSPGVVYPALIYMEETGLIAPVAGDGARKAFEATEEGRARAQADADKAAELKGRLAALAAQRDRVDPAPVRRAFHALKTAVFDRLSHEGADRDFILQVADVIDEATRKIERIEK